MTNYYRTADHYKAKLQPAMDSKVYSGISLVIEIFVLVVRIFLTMIESVYRMFVPVPEKSVAGQIVLITGTGHGMGRELALQFADLGAIIVCVDINSSANEETVNMVNTSARATKAYGYQCDVSNEVEVAALVEKVKKDVGFVSIVVNNAGIMPCHRFLTYTPEEIRRLFGINVFAHIWLLQGFLPEMIEKNQGHIITLSSMAGVLGIENLVPYCGTKFAVRGMIEALHEEIRLRTTGTNIKFTVIYPYMVDTGLCQKPIIRFPQILSLVSAKEAARQIIQNARRNVLEQSVPASLLGVNNFFRLFPHKAGILLKDFLGSSVEEHDS